MGTLPGQGQRDTKFVTGCEGIQVRMVDGPVNPYKAIFTIATSTWGTHNGRFAKWEQTELEGRKMVVIAALRGQTLQGCLEAPKFTFEIEGCSRSAFDQLARQRMGAVFGSIGTRDNNWKDASFIVPDYIADNPELFKAYQEIHQNLMDMYETVVDENKASWQVARFMLPIGSAHYFSYSANYLALKGMMAHRLTFCEQFDTVGVAWSLWKALHDKFPMLAAYCRPACDFAQKCLYHKAYSLSEHFGCIFRSCGRNIDKSDYQYNDFNEVGGEVGKIEKQLEFHIPRPAEWKCLEEDGWTSDIDYFKD